MEAARWLLRAIVGAMVAWEEGVKDQTGKSTVFYVRESADSWRFRLPIA